MKAVRLALLCAAVARLSAGDVAETLPIRSAPLNPAQPYFVPTHPRVTTTIRFPREIGAPDGAVGLFTEDAEKGSGAEYLVSWQLGDAYLTVTPLKSARLANLNVPYQGRTYVVYFYPVDEPMNAVASFTLEDPPAAASTSAIAPGTPHLPTVPAFRRDTALSEPSTAPATPARLLGFLDRLKLIHATPAGPSLMALAAAMNVDIAIAGSPFESARGHGNENGAAAAVPALNDFGWFQIVLLRVVRDSRINCVGFIGLVRNTSDQTLAFDVNSFGARAGPEYLAQRISDAAPSLGPREQAPAYFIVETAPNSPLRAGNAWRISVDLVRPRLNPGAMLSRGFAAEP